MEWTSYIPSKLYIMTTIVYQQWHAEFHARPLIRAHPMHHHGAVQIEPPTLNRNWCLAIYKRTEKTGRRFTCLGINFRKKSWLIWLRVKLFLCMGLFSACKFRPLSVDSARQKPSALFNRSLGICFISAESDISIYNRSKSVCLEEFLLF